jgi:hypothetical protein
LHVCNAEAEKYNECLEFESHLNLGNALFPFRVGFAVLAQQRQMLKAENVREWSNGREKWSNGHFQRERVEGGSRRLKIVGIWL